MSGTLKVLAVISNQSLLAKVESLMRRRTLEVNHVSSGAGALVLAGNLRYELLVLQVPLPDLDLDELLSEMQALDSTTQHAGFLVLSTDGVAPESLFRRHQSEMIKVVAADADAVTIHDAISELLGVAARRSARLLVHVEVELTEGSAMRLYQSQNLSESGILLRGGTKLEIGSKVGFELGLPGGDAVRGHAIVVRHTTPKEQVVGAALRFLDLEPTQLSKLRNFVYAGLTSEEEPSPLEAVGGGQ